MSGRTLFEILVCCCVAILSAQDSSARTLFQSGGVADSMPDLRPWPVTADGLSNDSRVIWGRLPNGLSYALLPNASVPGQASMRLCVEVGSLMERDDQRGLAHFLEHMAFNGTRNFPAGQTIEYFQRRGMEFGAHTNAVTQFDTTTYKLELPNSDQKMSEDCLRLFRDILDGLLLDPDEVSRERGIVLSEAREADTSSFRALVASLQFLLPDSKLGQRLPIGRMEIISQATSENLREFHQTWYRPDRAILVVAGDFQPLVMQSLIERSFASLVASQLEIDYSPDGFPAKPGIRAMVHRENGFAETTLTLAHEMPLGWNEESLERQRQEIAQALTVMMLNSRLSKLTESFPAIISASAKVESLFGRLQEASLTANIDPARCGVAIEALEQEIRRVAQFGFGDSEFRLAWQQLNAVVEQLVSQAGTEANNRLADRLLKACLERRVFLPDRDGQKLLEQFRSDIAPSDCQAIVAQTWASTNLGIILLGNENLTFTEQQVLDTFHSSQKKSIDFELKSNLPVFAYGNFGTPGEVVDRNEIGDLGISELTFANGTRLAIKSTQFKSNSVQVSVRFGEGLLESPLDRPALAKLAESVFIAGGLQKHSLKELNRILSDKSWSAIFRVEQDAFSLIGESSTRDFPVLLAVLAAYLKEPAFRPEALAQVQLQLGDFCSYLDHSLEGVLRDQAVQYLHGGDTRFGFPPRSDLDEIRMEEIAGWLSDALLSGRLEVCVAGDVDVDKVIAGVANTFGALPARRSSPKINPSRLLNIQLLPEKEIHFASESPSASVGVYWPIPGSHSARHDRGLQMIARIFQDRLRVKIREELGATYSPSVFAVSDPIFTDYGFVAAELQVDAAEVERVSRRVLEIGGQLAEPGTITGDELERARKVLLRQLKSDARDNNYWLQLLSGSRRQPQLLDEFRDRTSDYESIDLGEVESLASQYLAASRASRLHVIPERTRNSADSRKN